MISCSIGLSQVEYGVIVISLAFLFASISATSWVEWKLELSAMNIGLINRIIIIKEVFNNFFYKNCNHLRDCSRFASFDCNFSSSWKTNNETHLKWLCVLPDNMWLSFRCSSLSHLRFWLNWKFIKEHCRRILFNNCQNKNCRVQHLFKLWRWFHFYILATKFPKRIFENISHDFA